MKEFFEAVEFLFVEILFFPFDFIRLDITSWIFQNAINFSFIFIITAALVYWTLELVKYDKNEGVESEVTAHSFL
jgi:hypothetical protein